MSGPSAHGSVLSSGRRRCIAKTAADKVRCLVERRRLQLRLWTDLRQREQPGPTELLSVTVL